MLGTNTTTARIRLALEGQGEVVRGLGEVQSGLSGMRRAFASIAGGLSLGAAVGQLVGVQREMDVLNASLVTVTGSSAAADQNLRWIKTFAANTPFQLNEVTGAFIKMKALGLDASEQALRSYGNTASAMGKDLNQFIEAVADAATGEFERLKEFGIKASKQGDDVRFTFRGVTTSVKNSAAEITQYLQNIGNTDFAGAMDRRVTTLDGAISNLSDTWDELFRTVNEAGVGSLIETTVRGATRAIGGLGDAIRENKAELAVLTGALAGTALVATLPRMASGFLLVAGGVRALGAALLASPLTLALLGIGAGAGALIGFNAAKNTTVEGIRKQITLIEQAEATSRRSNLDAATAEALRIKRTEQLLALRQKLRELEGPAEGSVASGDVALRPAEAAAAAAAAGAADGLNPKTPQGKRVKEALDELHKYSADTQAKFAQILIDKTADWQAEALQEQLASNQVESFFRMAEIEAEARWQAQQEKAEKAAQDAADKLRQAEVAEWQKANEQITQSLTDSLFDGGKSFLDNLASYARTVVLRPIIAPIGAALGGLLGGPAAAATGSGGAGDLLGSIGQLSGLSSALGTGIAAGFANAITGTFAGSLSAAGSLIGTSTAAGVSAGVGMAIGTVAPYALAAYGVYKLLTAKTPGEQHQGGYYSSLGFSGLEGAARITGSGANSGQARDLIDRASPELTSQVRTSVDAIVASVTGMAQTLGNQVALGLDLGFAANLNGEAGNKNAFGYFGVSANGQLGRTYQNRELGTDPAAAYQQLTTEAANALADVVLGNSGLVRAGESSLQTLTRLSTSLQGVNATLDTLGQRALAVGLAGGNAASQLADLFGGLQAFNTAAGAYYQAFYSEQERTATSTRQLTTALAGLGLALPQTRSAYRQLVEAQDLTTEAGRRTYASLLQLAPTFDQIAKAREQEATAAQALSQALQSLGESITEEINRLRGLAGGTTTAQAYVGLQGRFATTTAQARAGDQQALEALPGISQALEEAAGLQASTASELALIRQQLAASLAATLGAAGLQVPALATGTNFVPHDMLIQAHRGEAVVPAAYNPAAGGALGGSAEAVAELRTLRDRLDRLIATQGDGFAAVAGHTAKTARILERVTPTGDALLILTQTELDDL